MGMGVGLRVHAAFLTFLARPMFAPSMSTWVSEPKWMSNVAPSCTSRARGLPARNRTSSFSLALAAKEQYVPSSRCHCHSIASGATSDEPCSDFIRIGENMPATYGVVTMEPDGLGATTVSPGEPRRLIVPGGVRREDRDTGRSGPGVPGGPSDVVGRLRLGLAAPAI